MKTALRIRFAALLLAATGATLGSVAATAESTTPPPAPPPQHGPGEHGGHFDPERRLARLTTDLSLTADQQTKLRAIFTAEAAEMKKLDETALTGEQRRTKMRELHKANRESIAALLTPEQKQKFAAMHPKGPKGRRHGEAGGPPPPHEGGE